MRLNKKILEQLTPELAALWEVSKRTKIQDSDFRYKMQRAVARARASLNREGQDILDRKVESFGNSGGWGLHKVQEFSKLIFQDKGSPEGDLGQWLSVEIELVMPNKSAEMQFVSFVRKAGYSKLVTIKHDGSIKLKQCDCDIQQDEDGNDVIDHNEDCEADSRTAYGREIVVTFKYGQWDILKSICDKLNSLKCTVNKTCGLHVHFDMRHCDERREVSTIGQRVAKAVPALKQILPASRQNNEFCEQTINTMNGSESRRDRYAFVNVMAYRRHKTLEIRGHSGTTDATKVINWIRILKAVMAKPNRSELLTLEAMMAKINFDADLQLYMLTRRQKFANAHRQTDDVSNDNRTVETGQHELFQIGVSPESVRISVDAQDSLRYAYFVNINGQAYQLTDQQLREALDVQNIEPLVAQLSEAPASNDNANVA